MQLPSTKKVFGYLCAAAFIGWTFFSILYYNNWHAIPIFGVGIAAYFLLKD